MATCGVVEGVESQHEFSVVLSARGRWVPLRDVVIVGLGLHRCFVASVVFWPPGGDNVYLFWCLDGGKTPYGDDISVQSAWIIYGEVVPNGGMYEAE